MLIAVDSSVLLDEQVGDDSVTSALETIKWRFKNPGLIIPPSVIGDLDFQNQNCTGDERIAAGGVLRNMLERGYSPMNLVPVGHGIVEQLAYQLRRRGCLPDENETDALIVAETALIGCEILLTSLDSLIQAGHHDGFRDVLKSADVSEQLLITSPQGFIEKYLQAERR